MATITPTIDRDSVPGAVLATWAAMATGDVGAGVPIAYAADLTGQVTGTFGGGTITWQGSNDNTNWHPLTRGSWNGHGLHLCCCAHCQRKPSVGSSRSYQRHKRCNQRRDGHPRTLRQSTLLS